MATILGLDMDPTTLRGVVLKTALRKSQITGYIAVPLAPASSPEEREEILHAAVRQLLAAVGQPPDRVVTELSGDEVATRLVTFPAKVAKRAAELLPHELEGVVPFDPDESIIDYQPVESNPTEVKLLAAITPIEKVRAHLDRFAALGVEPREIAIGAAALDGLVPLVPALATPGPHCLIDIHPEGTDVCILADGTCRFARTLSVSIADLDEGRQHLLERELRQTMAGWRMEGGASPSAFYVGGAMAAREGCDAWLEGIVGAPVELLPLPTAPGADESNRPTFARAAALAGRSLGRGKRLNARQGELAAKQTMTALRQHLPLFASCAAAILVAFLFSSYARYTVLEARHQQLEDELARVTERYFGHETRTADAARRLLTSGVEGHDPLPLFDAYDALAAISDSISTSITHDVQQLEIDLGDGEESGRFQLRASVRQAADSSQIRNALAEHRFVQRRGDTEVRFSCFRDLQLGSTDRVGEVYRYRLEGKIHCRPQDEDQDEDDDSDSNQSRRRN